jgi:hypothetical protein
VLPGLVQELTEDWFHGLAGEQIAHSLGRCCSVPASSLSVPKTSSTSCDQAVFVDQATDMSLFSDAVLVEAGRFG